MRTPLQGIAIYLDRTVYSRVAEKRKQTLLKEKIKVMGGTLVDDPNEAAIILGHPGYTLLDRAYDDTRAMIVSYHYVEEHYGDGNAPSYLKYATLLQPRTDSAFAPAVSVGPAAPKMPDSFVESDLEVERAVAPEVDTHVGQSRAVTVAQRRALVEPQGVFGHESGRKDAAPPNQRIGDRATQASAVGCGKALPEAPESAPVPTFRVPERSPFVHGEVRDWACSFVQWSTTYSPSRPDSAIVRRASLHMHKIIPPFRLTTFRNFVAKDQEFSARVTQVIRHARTNAERHSVQEISEKGMNMLVSAAGRAYRSQYGRSSASPTKGTSSKTAPVPSTSKNERLTPVIPPPHLPVELFFPGGQKQCRFNGEGHAYMRKAYRWLLLLHPTRNWSAMARDMRAASNGQISGRAFDEYRRGQARPAFAEIMEEYEADPAAFRVAYDELFREAQPEGNDSVSDGEPARKRRKLEPHMSDHTNDEASSRSSTRVPSPLSPTATVEQDGSD